LNVIDTDGHKLFLQAKTFTKKMLTQQSFRKRLIKNASQKGLPKNMMKRAMPLKICLPAQQKEKKSA